MNHLPEYIIPVIKSMAALNQWVRSESFKHQSSTLRKWIYHLKREMIRRIHKEWPKNMVHERVGVAVDCTRCKGTGIWKSWEDDLVDKCRHCSGRGRLMLYFVQSEIYEIQGWPKYHLCTWHTPSDQWPMLAGVEIRNQWPHWPSDWATQQQGRDLWIEDAAVHLNVVEGFLQPESVWEWGGDRYDDYRFNLADYHLHIGHSDSGICTICKQNNPDGCYCCTGFERLYRSLWVCNACSNVHGNNIFNHLKTIWREVVPIGKQLHEWMLLHSEAAEAARSEK